VFKSISQIQLTFAEITICFSGINSMLIVRFMPSWL